VAGEQRRREDGLSFGNGRPRAMTPGNKRQRKAKPEIRDALKMTLKGEWFYRILEGTKKIEYRAYSAFWKTRLIGIRYKEVHFRNGYHRDSPFMRVECGRIRTIGKGRSRQFAIGLGRVLEAKHYSRSQRLAARRRLDESSA
jgi:hypothetical protein